MPQGKVTVFNKTMKNLGDDVQRFSSYEYKIMLLSVMPDATLDPPDSSQCTEVVPGAGSVYVAGGVVVTITWEELEGVVSFGSSTATWLSNYLNEPEDIVAALLYTTEASVTEDVVAMLDMTPDEGVTPLSLMIDDISVSFPSGVFTMAKSA